ncbi:MAG: hypothetical protein ACM3RQ_00625 [Methanocella sp.]
MNAYLRTARWACAAMLAIASVSALAHGSVHFGIGIGIPGPWYYAPPVYYPYYPPAVVVPAPSAYVEQAPSPVYSTRPVQSFYYYCAASKGYYPYVRDCPGGWERVPTRPR